MPGGKGPGGDSVIIGHQPENGKTAAAPVRIVSIDALQRTLEIVIDHLPYRELSPNSREHFIVKARAVKAQREEAGWLAKVQWNNQKPMEYARISYVFCIKDKRHRDMDNLVASAKSFQDGLVDAGVIGNDDSAHLELGRCRILLSNTNQTIITVNELVG